MSLLRRTGTVVLAMAFAASSATFVMARDHDDHCQDKVRKAEDKLHRDEQKRGNHSKQVEKDRRSIEQARARCDANHDHDRH